MSYWKNRLAWARQVQADRGLRSNHKVVLWALEGFFNNKTFIAWPSISTLQKLTGLSRATVWRAILAAEARHHLSINRRRNPDRSHAANVYTPLLKSEGWRAVGVGVPVEHGRCPSEYITVEFDSYKYCEPTKQRSRSLPNETESEGRSLPNKEASQAREASLPKEEPPSSPSFPSLAPLAVPRATARLNGYGGGA